MCKRNFLIFTMTMLCVAFVLNGCIESKESDVVEGDSIIIQDENVVDEGSIKSREIDAIIDGYGMMFEDPFNSYYLFFNWRVASIYSVPENTDITTAEAWEFENEEIEIYLDRFVSSTLTTQNPIYKTVVLNNDDLKALGIGDAEIEFDFISKTNAIIVYDSETGDSCMLFFKADRSLMYVSKTGYIFKLEPIYPLQPSGES